ncbi:hypothetical protein PENTCL1PPCAC_15928, partial [Pristionchus entomophagus]
SRSTTTSSTSIDEASTSASPVLGRIRDGYKTMTRMRRLAELCLRPRDQFVHPSTIDKDEATIINATHELVFRTAQVLMSALFDFASIAFPDFVTLTADERWHLVSGCADRVNIIESTYRAAKMYPDDERIFVAYTLTLSPETVDDMLRDCPQNEHKEKASEALIKTLKNTAGKSKRAMRRTNPSEEEFLYMIALAFWNTDAPAADDRLHSMALTNRSAIMRDIASYYSARGVNEYATRIGELFCLLVNNESVTYRITEDVELLRLMDINEQPRM